MNEWCTRWASKWDEEGKKQFQMDWKTEQRCCARTTPLSSRVIRGLLSFFFFLEEVQRKMVSSSVLDLERIDFNVSLDDSFH